MTPPDAAYAILEILGRQARTFSADPDVRPIFFDHRSAIAEALARTDLAGAAEAAADLQVGPGEDVTHSFRVMFAGRDTYEADRDFSKEQVEWLYSNAPELRDLVRFVVMNENSVCFVVGATRSGPLVLQMPEWQSSCDCRACRRERRRQSG